MTDAALAWLDARPDQPFFLWLHYFGPHGKPDWRLPEGERESAHQRSYDAELAETDRQIARLLEGLDTRGLARDTLVLLHADHGESLGEQHYVGHGWLLNETEKPPCPTRCWSSPTSTRPGSRCSRTTS